MSEDHKLIRDEQFWYTTAVVGFNSLVMRKDASPLPVGFLLLASAVISILGLHLILTRWVRNAIAGSRIVAPQFDNKTATAYQRAKYTLWEVRAYVREFVYIVSELSGTLFYVLIVITTFFGAVIRCIG